MLKTVMTVLMKTTFVLFALKTSWLLTELVNPLPTNVMLITVKNVLMKTMFVPLVLMDMML